MEFVPLRVQFIDDENRFEYIGLSCKFQKVAEGSHVPTYAIKVTNQNRKIIVDAELITPTKTND